MLLRFLLSIWRALLFFIDTLVILASRGPRLPARGIQKVLVLRMDSIGDFILWLDSAKEYRKLFPPDRYEITLLGNSLWKDLAGGLPFFDRYLFFSRRRFLRNPVYRYRLLKTIKTAGFDLLIQPRFSREFMLEDAVARCSNAPERITAAGDCANITGWQKQISTGWYTRIVPATDKPLMELKRNAEFVRGLGLSEFKAGIPGLQIPETALSIFDKMPESYYLLAPGAGIAWRRWPVQFFAVLAEKIFSAANMTGIVCGGPAELKLTQELVKETKAPLINLTGSVSLPQLAALIQKAKLLVSNETAAVHMAAAFNTPCVCITGGGHFGRFLPYTTETTSDRILPVPVFSKMDCFGCNWKNRLCRREGRPVPCIENITVAMVWQEVKNALDSKKTYA